MALKSCSACHTSGMPAFVTAEHISTYKQTRHEPPCGRRIESTFGCQNGDFGCRRCSALEYSACARFAAGTSSPSALLMTTRSASSTIPFLIPYERNMFASYGPVKQRANLKFIASRWRHEQEEGVNHVFDCCLALSHPNSLY